MSSCRRRSVSAASYSRLLLGTANLDKVREIESVLAGLPLTILSARDVSIPDVSETEPTLEGNAALKATTIAADSGLVTLSDDTGLEVMALDGAPGVFSARYAGADATYADNNEKLLEALIDREDRSARFRTVVACAAPSGLLFSVEGVCEGCITEELRGAGGFGYDPVFYVPEVGKTYAEMTLQEKNGVSHRGRALAAFCRQYGKLLAETSR